MGGQMKGMKEEDEIRKITELRAKFISRSLKNRTFSAFAATELKRGLDKIKKTRKKLSLKVPKDK